MTAAPSLLFVSPKPGANDDAAARPELAVTITMRLEPQWPGTAPVPTAEIRRANGQLVEVFDGSDGVRVLGEAIEYCAELGLSVGAIVEAPSSPAPSPRVAARQRNAAQRAWQVWQ